MTITDCLNRIKLIKKKILKNNLTITTFSSRASTEIMGDDDERLKSKVKEMYQSTRDLTTELSLLKRKIQITNLKTTVKLPENRFFPRGKVFTLEELLYYKKEGCALIQQSLNAMNDSAYKESLRSRMGGSQGNDVTRKLFYDEIEKSEALNELSEFESEIHSALDRINPTTETIETI